ncbi:MAG: D-aminoacylase [Nitrospirae bacterium]|jgi:N-acyl-D-amino-acid deacylase|nr:D-aminoacylase [Nitrospirota bacterium]
MSEKVNILIKNGLIFDGTGSEPFEADIGIKKDRIAFIKKKTDVFADRVIEARGLAVTPGFIDTHAHSDFTILADPRAEGKVSQGVTTEINGNCGLSAAPLFGEVMKRREEDLNDLGIKERWSEFKEYFEILGNRKPALNFMTLAGHGNIRACIMGYEYRTPDENDLIKMQALLRKTIEDGATGLSTGLIYPPGLYSTTEELIELCRILKQTGKYSHFSDNDNLTSGYIYTSHIRSEGDRLLESIEEVINIGKEAGVKVHISHIKTGGEKNWHKIDAVISLIEEARDRGIKITCDRYPYVAASTDLDTILPFWVYEGGKEREMERLRNTEVKERIKKEIEYKYPDKGYWNKIYIAAVDSESRKWMEGKSIAEIAHRKDSDHVDMLINILIEEKLRVSAIFYSMSEDNLKRFLMLPYVMIGTDSSARCASGPTRKGKPHPRGFGSFPIFLGRYVRDGSLMNLSEAVKKITMIPAKTFGIDKRGIITEGAFADIVVFDHERITDRATFDDPYLKPKGIHYVIINGLTVLWEGELTGIRPGRILSHKDRGGLSDEQTDYRDYK